MCEVNVVERCSSTRYCRTLVSAREPALLQYSKMYRHYITSHHITDDTLITKLTEVT